MYQLSFHRKVLKQLKKLPKDDRVKILKKIRQLRYNPMNFNLDIRPYYNAEKGWRIRAGNLRAIYTFDIKNKVIYIEYLGYRGSVYKK